MNNRSMKFLGIAALVAQSLVVAACSSSNSAGAGGAAGGTNVTGTGGSSGIVLDPANPGSCTPGTGNPDYATGGACAPGCQSVSCTTSMSLKCTQDCCVTCGIDQLGVKLCTCTSPGGPYTNCSCPAPAFIPAPPAPALTGGACSPNGSSLPTDQDATSLRGKPCKTENLVCFTTDSTGSSERGCICRPTPVDGGATILTLHCGSVNHWFQNDGTTTTYSP
jgi:hypothetical protein